MKYLQDAGYGLSDVGFIPYRGVRYHLHEWTTGRRKPANMRELYNLRQSSLRIVIEKIFGILKKRFPILNRFVEYHVTTHNQIIYSLCALQNYIVIHDSEDSFAVEPFIPPIPERYEADEHVNQDSNTATALRDEIAQKMWNDYLMYHQEDNTI